MERITRGTQRIAGASDVTVRNLDASVLRQGVHEGEALPVDVQLSVPAGERVAIGGQYGTIALDGATDTFHYTGRFESVSMLAQGQTEIIDPSDEFRFFGVGFVLAVHDGSCVVNATDREVTVTRTSGTVLSELLGSNSAFVWHVDVLTGKHPSATYTPGDRTFENVPLTDDQSAAAAGDASGEFNLAMRFYFGEGVATDSVRAMQLLRAAAAQRFAEAENNIGYAYLYRISAAHDPSEAVRWLQLAAADGSGAAGDNLGDMYNYGHGVPQSYAQAMHWYELAAVLGDGDAENDIGLLYAFGHAGDGRNASPEYARALYWFRVSAAQGNGDAENDMGYMYLHGYGVAQDYAQALYWYRLAAAHGVPNVTATIQRIERLQQPP